MDIAAILRPYTDALSAAQIVQVTTYRDLLLRWNARMNLTAVRDPEHVMTRHFGESFFLAEVLFGPGGFGSPGQRLVRQPDVLDVGSGAGFPGIPLKIFRPEITLTLVEAQQRKAVFLREVLRALKLEAEVKNVRAEELSSSDTASIVTFRAVEKFDAILRVAAALVRRDTQDRTTHPDLGGHGLCLLVGSAQIVRAQQLLPHWRFRVPVPIPNTQNRVVQLVEPR